MATSLGEVIAASASRHSGSALRALAQMVVVVGAVIGVDLLTKHLVRSQITPGEPESVLLGIHLVHVSNTGVAFGFLSGGGGALVLALVAAALVAVIVYFALRPGRRLAWLPTGLLLGGALGNLIDRLAHGAVTDFIKLPHWPAFNVADIAITVGVLALLYVVETQAAPGRGRS